MRTVDSFGPHMSVELLPVSQSRCCVSVTASAFEFCKVAPGFEENLGGSKLQEQIELCCVLHPVLKFLHFRAEPSQSASHQTKQLRY
jgi:hypothetical protein